MTEIGHGVGAEDGDLAQTDEWLVTVASTALTEGSRPRDRARDYLPPRKYRGWVPLIDLTNVRTFFHTG